MADSTVGSARLSRVLAHGAPLERAQRDPAPSAPVENIFERVTSGIDSGRGLALLKSCDPRHLTDLPSLMRHHQIQESLALCGVASATMVLNSLHVSTRPILEQ